MSVYDVCLTPGFWDEHEGWSGADFVKKYGGYDRNWRRKRSYHVKRTTAPAAVPTVKESTEILASGDHVSCKLVAMVEAQGKDPEFLLTAHGFDPAEWELVAARNNLWHQHSAAEGRQTLYQSRITAKPLGGAFDFRRVVEALRAVEPVKVERPRGKASDSLLEVPLFDMHFGNSFIEDYTDTLGRVRKLITAEKRAEVLLPIGSDLMHNDNFRKQTASGTAIEGMDYPRAWADAFAFYSAVLTDALKHARRVVVVYVKGNHDESMSWAFVQTLKARFPQAEYEDAIQERKLHTFGDVAIGLTHGEKAVKDFDRIFMAEFPAFARARVKEIHTAHVHHEVTKDRCGIMIRSLSTANLTDQWHRDSGYVGACKRFQVFEYEADSLTAIHYV